MWYCVQMWLKMAAALWEDKVLQDSVPKTAWRNVEKGSFAYKTQWASVKFHCRHRRPRCPEGLPFLLSRSLHRSTRCGKRQEHLLTLQNRTDPVVALHPVSLGAGLQRGQIRKQVLATRAWHDLTSRLRPRLTASDLRAWVQHVRMNECGRNPDRPCRSSLFKYEEFVVYFLPPLMLLCVFLFSGAAPESSSVLWETAGRCSPSFIWKTEAKTSRMFLLQVLSDFSFGS